MNPLIFNDINYYSITIGEVPAEISIQLNTSGFKPNKCLLNSYEIAKNIKNVRIVEGWLVTKFEDENISCVGHVWNEYNGNYFDVSYDLVKHDKIIISTEYYLIESYSVENAAIEEVQDFSQGFNFYSKPVYKRRLNFKTKAKVMEKQLVEFLNNRW